MIAAIDMWAPIVPSTEIIEHVAQHFPPQQLQYLKVFTKQQISAEQFRAYAHSLVRDDDEIRADLDAAGITRSLITGFDEASTCWSTSSQSRRDRVRYSLLKMTGF